MCNSKDFERAAELIWECWLNGTFLDQLPIKLRPKTRAEGYKIQSYLEKFSGRPLFGWKIAATSLSGQNHIGVSGPLAGRIFKERVFSPDTTLKFGANKMAVAEPEFAFKIGKSLSPKLTPYRESEVLALIDSLHPAIELPNSRFNNFAVVGEEQLIADNACAHEFVIGPPMGDSWRDLNLAKHKVTISTLNGGVSEGAGSNVMDGPILALTWLVNELSRHNLTLMAGSIIATGTCAPPLPIKPGDNITADYGNLGSMQVNLAYNNL